MDRAFLLAYERANSSAPNPIPAPPSPLPPELRASEPSTLERAPIHPPLRPCTSIRWPATVQALGRMAAAELAVLADRLLAAGQGRSEGFSLLFTGSERGTGRTTLLLALARVLGRRSGKERVLLVDGDSASPDLARLLNLRPRAGLDDLLLRRRRLADVLIEAPREGVTILPMRRALPAADLLGDPLLRALLTELRQRHPLVLIDGGPAVDAASWAPLADAAVLVVPEHAAGGPGQEHAAARLEQAGIPLLGWAESFVRTGKGKPRGTE